MSTEAADQVGWIGTGEMGAPMCMCLLDDSVELTVWNRTRAKTEVLRSRGAKVAESIAELAALDVLFVMVTGDVEVSDVVREVLSAPTCPELIVNCSTVSEAASASVRAHSQKVGVEFLAAAISAGPTMIEDGTAAIVASGPDTAFARAERLLSTIARTVVYAGPGDTAALVKLCSNVVMGTFTQNLYELAELATKAGVGAAAFFDFVNGSVIGSSYSEFKAAQYLGGQTQLGEHQRSLMRRDFDLCLDVARGLGASLPISEAAREQV